jgi:hypothetical protein
MSLTPFSRGFNLDAVYPLLIDYSAFSSSSMSSIASVAINATLAVGFKPTSVSTSYPLCDPTSHYLLTIQKTGTTVSVWKQDVVLGSYTTSATTYAGLLMEALVQYSGGFAGYLSRLIVLEGTYDYTTFYRQSPTITSLWVPASVTPSAHTYLSFDNALNLGEDTSGNGNDWTFSSAVQSIDTPTDNFATLNPLGSASSEVSVVSGLLSAIGAGAGAPWGCATATVGADRKAYFEVQIGAGVNPSFVAAGVIVNPSNTNSCNLIGDAPNSWGVQTAGNDLYLYNNGNGINMGAWGDTDDVAVYGIAVDPELGKVWVRKNNSAWFGGGDPVAGTSPTFTTDTGLALPAVSVYDSTTSCVCDFGQNGYSYSAPSGFLPVKDASRKEPEVLNVNEHYFGGTFVAPVGGSQAIVVGWDASASGFGMRLKSMVANEYWHYISTVAGLGYEVRQGASGTLFPKSALTTPVTVVGNIITIPDDLLTDGGTYIVEIFRIGAESGFNIVTYTGDGLAGHTIPHGLGRAPFFVVSMSNDATARYKCAFSLGLVNLTDDTYFAFYNADSAVSSNTTVWNATRPDATNVTLGNNSAINEVGGEFTLWVWSDVTFYRNIEFTGNGNANGPFIHLDGRFRGIIASKGAGNSAWTWGNTTVNNHNPVTTGGVFLTYTTIYTPATYLVASSVGYKIVTSTATYNTNTWAFSGIAVVDQIKYKNAF